MEPKGTLSILGTGNIGRAIAIGVTASKCFAPGDVILTRRKVQALEDLGRQGFQTQSDNRDAVRRSEIVIVAVEPQQLDGLLADIAGDLDPERHLLISRGNDVNQFDYLRLSMLYYYLRTNLR